MVKKQILLIPSHDVTADIEFLVDNFSQVFKTTDDDTTLEAGDSVLILLKATEARSGMIPWVTELTDELASCPLASSTELDTQLAVRLPLPSGTHLLLCPPRMESLHCQMLAKLLRGEAERDSSEHAITEHFGLNVAQQLPKFPSLDVRLLDKNGSYAPFPLNSPVPIPIETDLFCGKMLVVLRPPNPEQDDPFWNERIFSHRQRRVIIQIQGKFLRKPRGIVYAGAQVSDPMKLGLITRGVCSVLLRLVESFKKDVHYSYGTAVEAAHIVAPAYSFFERVVVTPDGETPPPMEETFPESQESIAQRKVANGMEWNTTDTYSFSFFSMYIDLALWKLVNIPATGDLRLQTFWGNSMLNICMYEKLGDSPQHLDNEKNFVFSLQAAYVDKEDNELQLTRRGGDGSDTDSVALLPWSERKRSGSESIPLDSTPPARTIPHSESQVFGSLDLASLTPIPYASELKVTEENELNFFDAEQEHDDTAARTFDAVNLSDLLNAIDSKCPFWIEQYRGNSTTTLFALNVKSSTTFQKGSSCQEMFLNTRTKECSRRLNMFSPRLSSQERLRRSIGLVLSGQGMSALEFLPNNDENRITCLPEGSTVVQENGIVSGTVGRAISDRHWVEEWATISEDGGDLLFYRSSERKRHHFHVKLSTVSYIEELPQDLSPRVFGYAFLALTTIGRTLYLMVSSKKERDTWKRVLDDLIRKQSTMTEAHDRPSNQPNVLRLFDIENVASEFLHNSTMWRCKSKRILNCAKFHFCEGNRLSNESSHPLDIAMDALKKTLSAQERGLEDSKKRLVFLDSVARLKAVSLEYLEEDEKLVFFLNLYHVMVAHAFMVLGPPDSSLKWIKYFNNIAYQTSDDIFSLAELEHCIIRPNMTYPSQFFSKFVIPKTKFRWGLATTNDFRINFALNCGSLCIPATILCYETETMEEQLNEAARLYLESSTCRTSGSGTAVLTVPRVLQWYADDFGDDVVSRLNAIRPFLSPKIQAEVASARRWEFRYQPFSFECRPFLCLNFPDDTP